MFSDTDYSSLFQWLESISSLKAFKARLSELKSLYDHTEASIKKLKTAFSNYRQLRTPSLPSRLQRRRD
jgi:hypothetical protein